MFRKMSFFLLLTLLCWLALTQTAGFEIPELDNPDGVCPDDRPPMCPSCIASSYEECDSNQQFVSCTLPSDICVTTTTISVRGVVERIVRGCRPASETCADETTQRCANVNVAQAYKVICAECNNKMRTCPSRYGGGYKTMLLSVLLSVSCVVGVILLVAVFKTCRERCSYGYGQQSLSIRSSDSDKQWPFTSDKPRYTLLATA